MPHPVFYSFRRCPYAMRARLALTSARQQVELREILLRDKPDEMVEASPKATVPVMVRLDGSVLDESLDIMLWALEEKDPENWLRPETGTKSEMLDLMDRMDNQFKHHLDNYKYASRKAAEGTDPKDHAAHHRSMAMTCLRELEDRLEDQTFLFGNRHSLADSAIAPFVRQFANTDAEWFAAQPIPNLQRWLSYFVDGDLFKSVMEKYPQWQTGEPGVSFPQLP